MFRRGSKTAATNANADTAINWAEGQDAASVNNSSRSEMASVAKYIDDTDGALAAGGTANALTVTTNQVLSAAHLAAGLRLTVRATAANTSSTVTFAPDGLTPANIRRADGSSLFAGDIYSGMYLDLVYNAGSSEWRCLNIAPMGLGRIATFFASKSSNQAVATTAAVGVTFTTEAFDVGSFFTTGWQPPSGTVFLGTQINVINSSGGSGAYSVAIRLNGGVISQFNSTGNLRERDGLFAGDVGREPDRWHLFLRRGLHRPGAALHHPVGRWHDLRPHGCPVNGRAGNGLVFPLTSYYTKHVALTITH